MYRETQFTKAVAKRLKLSEAETKQLVDRYVGYLREVSGPGVKPGPPLLLVIMNNSRDHAANLYQEVNMSGYAAMNRRRKYGLCGSMSASMATMLPKKICLWA
jgi:hypothetical protein